MCHLESLSLKRTWSLEGLLQDLSGKPIGDSNAEEGTQQNQKSFEPQALPEKDQDKRRENPAKERGLVKICDDGKKCIQPGVDPDSIDPSKNGSIQLKEPFHRTKIKDHRQKVQTRGCGLASHGPCGTMNHMDKASWFGLVVGFGAILLGNVLEGGHFNSLVQFTAALIVIGGTMGAVMVSSPEKDLRNAMSLFRSAFRRENQSDLQRSIQEIVDATRSVRKENLLVLEKVRFSDGFVAKTVRNVLDGIDPQVIREIGEAEIDAREDEMMAAVKVWNDAGGFSPTIGIIGAVLGLIHVMGNLSDTSKLGAGIAVAFVATVYGVGFANLLFLPVANKLKKRVQRESRDRMVLLEGVLMMNTSLNPVVLEQKMKASITTGTL